MANRAIITSCSTKFFPSVINLISSIKNVYPDHPTIFVYNLGLPFIFRKEIEAIDNVKVIEMPKFCPHWRSCYTWKTYILANPLAKLNFYLDAGCELLKPLEEIFLLIDKKDILLIDQGQSFEAIVPKSYKAIFNLSDQYDKLTTIHAGIIGFKNTPNINNIFNKIYIAAYAGLALGFSPNDKWRNKGKDKNIFVRDCNIFRHDLTLLNIFFRKYYNDKIIIQSLNLFHGNKNVVPEQIIWQLRLSYSYLNNLKIKLLHRNINLLFVVNRFIIYLMIKIKNINIFIKKKLLII